MKIKEELKRVLREAFPGKKYVPMSLVEVIAATIEAKADTEAKE